jgi:hypothetical protein
MYRPALALLLAILWWPAERAAAQPDVEIWHDATNIIDTVMDFGVTLEGAPVTKTFKVVNRSNREVSILRTNEFADPYYLILNTLDVPPEDPRKEEFQAASPLPYRVAPGDTGSFGVTYRALKDNPLYPPDVATKALLELRVVHTNDSLGGSKDHRFLLRAIKTTKVLASSVQRIAFDSVYVFPAPSPPTEPYKVENVLSVPIPVERQVLQMITSVVGTPEIEVDTLFPQATFGPKGSLTWTTRYAPRDRGRDSAHFLLVYKPNENARADTLRTVIDGLGVEQRLKIVSATGVPNPVAVSGDTINFGDVDADGSGGVVATVILRNEGNINIRMLSETKNGIQRDTAAFKVVRELRVGGSTIRTNLFDTLVVRMDPIDGGEYIVRYVVQTDLRQRAITGVPDGAQTHTFTFRAFARKPQMVVSPPSIDLGSVVLLPQCSSASERQLSIRNVGNVDLIVDSAIVEPIGSPVTVTPRSARIGLSQTQIFTVRFEPTQLGLTSGNIVLYTNAFEERLEVPFQGTGIGPDSIRVRLDTTLRSRPGTPIVAAVHVDADRAPLAQTANITVAFDPSLLRYRSLIQTGTGSEGAAATATEGPRGVLQIDLSSIGHFRARDTLILISFDTYLGSVPRTALALTERTTKLGNAGCESVLDVTVQSGTYRIDSLCGLSIKTAGAEGLAIQAGIHPNPASDAAYVSILTGADQDLTIRILDMFGREGGLPTRHRLSPGLTAVPLTVQPLTTGIHYVEITTELQRLILPLMVER